MRTATPPRWCASARWLPYGVSQGAVDELVPVTSGLAQVQLLDAKDYRYHFEFFPAEDHLVYATQDRFGTLASWVGDRDADRRTPGTCPTPGIRTSTGPRSGSVRRRRTGCPG